MIGNGKEDLIQWVGRGTASAGSAKWRVSWRGDQAGEESDGLVVMVAEQLHWDYYEEGVLNRLLTGYPRNPPLAAGLDTRLLLLYYNLHYAEMACVEH